MEIRGYVIKGTYTSGKHAGKSFILVKGGYVAASCSNIKDIEDRVTVLSPDIYTTIKSAKIAASRFLSNSEGQSFQVVPVDKNSIAHLDKPIAGYVHG